MWQMTGLTGKDYRDILNLVYLANRCEDIESFINTLFPSIMQVFHAECATFQLIKGYPQLTEIVESRSFKSDSYNIYEDKHYPNLYRNSFYQYSPLLKQAISSPKAILKLGDSIPFRDWDRSDLYNYFIRPQYLYWELFLTLRWKNKLEGMVTLWRSKKQLDFEDREVRKAAMLAPHFGVAVHNICLISQVNKRKNHSLSVDEANSGGLLLLDHKFTPSFFNAEARSICLELLGRVSHNTSDLEKGEFSIPSCIIKDCSQLLDLLKAEEQLVLSPKERIVFTESGKKFRIECSLIWKADQINSMPNFMVILSDLNDEKKLEITLQARFQLGRRELDVIHYLTGGLSDDEIGEKLCISRQTVHTHIKNIYKKLGVKSRIELYRRVIQSSYPGIFDHQFDWRDLSQISSH
ncbi:MAG: response regulator transcription factor [Chloroflexota bacterium]